MAGAMDMFGAQAYPGQPGMGTIYDYGQPRNSFADPQAMALLGLAQGLFKAGGASPMPVGIGAALGQGIGGALSGAMGAQQANQQSQLLDMHAKLYGAQADKANADVARQARLAMIMNGGDQPSAAAGGTVGLSNASAGAIGAPWAAASGLPQPQSSPLDGYKNKAAVLAREGFLQEANQLADFVKKLSPNLEFKDGVWYDKDSGAPVRGGAGINPQGFGYQTAIGQNGQISVGALPGAEDLYGRQQDIGERSRARYDLVTVPATGPNSPPTFSSRLSLVAGSGDGQNTPTTPPGARPAGMSPAAASAQAADAAQQTSISQNFATTYNNLQNAAMANPAKIQRYQRIGDLLEGFNGGKYSGTGLEIARAASSAGLKIDPKLPNKEAAGALANEMSLELRNPAGGAGMPGALSDADREYLKSMTPGLAQTNEGRKQIIDARVKLMERENDVAMMARKYRQKYGKLDDSFFDQLQTWSGSNPIFKK